jgi:DNA-binding transcriptional regulator YhcF (GntR family)
LYQQIKGLILKSLQAGEWKPGESIPSEMDLAARFRVSQGTVRKAIDELAAENLLVRRQGKGTFVATHAEHHVQYRFLKLIPDDGDSQSVKARRSARSSTAGASAPVPTLPARWRLRTGDAGSAGAPGVVAFPASPTILEDIWLPGAHLQGSHRGSAEPVPMTAPCTRCSKPNSACAWCRAEERSAPSFPTLSNARACCKMTAKHAYAQCRACRFHL